MNSFKQIIFVALAYFFCASMINAQSTDPPRDIAAERAELMAKKAELSAEVAKTTGELNAVDAKLNNLPGWRKGLVGVVGFDLNGNNNWYALTTPNSSSTGIGIGINAFANNIQPKFFWRNLLNITVQRTSTKSGENGLDGNEAPAVIALSEGLDLSSLYGYRLTPKIAISAEGKYTTSLLRYLAEEEKYEASINDPGKLTVSAGITWTPIDALVVIVHPLGYELNFPGTLISSPGAKIGAVYTANIFKGISWSSNLSAFIPYGSGDVTYDTGDVATPTALVDYSSSDLINYTWINGFSMKIFNGIAVALNIGLRGDNQIADKGKYARALTTADVTNVESKGLNLQSYYTLGLGYTF